MGNLANRRTVLAMLGLGSASAVGAETFLPAADKAGELRSVCCTYDKERFARAFELLAAEIRRDAVETISLELRAILAADKIADQHVLQLTFRYLPEA